MTKQIYGGYDVSKNATALGKRTVQSIDGTALFDEKGNMDLDGYTEEELDNIISVLPLSHYGTHNYLPAGVSGDFVGAAESYYRRTKQFLENDGTLVVLRPGTNGSTTGLYYSYVPDIVNAISLTGSVNTNKQYMPGYIPPGFTPNSVFSTNNGLVCGTLNNDANGTVSTNFFTSFCNGTLDDTQHTGFIVPSSTVLPDGGELVFAMLGEDGWIYYFGTILSPTYALSVVRVNATTLVSERVSGFNGTVYSNQVNSPNILISNRLSSSVLTDEPYFWVNGNPVQALGVYMVQMDLFALQDASTGNIRVRINGDGYAETISSVIRPQHGFSFTFNPSTKAVQLDLGYEKLPGKAPLTINSGSTLTVEGNVLLSNPNSLYYHLGFVNLGNTYQYTTISSVICISTQNVQGPPLIQYAQFDDPTLKPYDMLNYKKYEDNLRVTKTGTMYESYGSPIGPNINSVQLLPNNSTYQISFNGFGNMISSYAVHKSTSDFTFKSLELGTILGYEPTNDRKAITNNNSKLLISSIDSAANVNTYGGVFVSDGYYTSSAFSYDMHMNETGTFSVDDSVLNAFKNSEVLKMGSPLGITPNTRCVLYVPQQTDIPAFALVTAISNTAQCIYRIVEVNVNSRSGVINTITFNRLVFEQLSPQNNYINNGLAHVSLISSGLSIQDCGSFYFIGITDPVLRTVVGNDHSYFMRAVVVKGNNELSSVNFAGTWNSYYTIDKPFCLPNKGFGTLNQLDLTCKSVFYPIGSTFQDFTNWIKSGSPINVVSMDVAHGFIVYFNEPTPVMLSGKSFILPITNIDLSTIVADPSNKTFHVYAKMVQGVAQYVITEDVIAETGTIAYNLLWIGTIKTNDLQIADIDIFKRSRIDIFGESIQAAGGSFPVSTGLPSGTGTISW